MRGGAREGAGRKSLPDNKKKKFVTCSISGTPEEMAELKSKAKEQNKTVSRFVLDFLQK